MGNIAELDLETGDVKPTNMDFDPLPDGRYLVEMVDSNIKPTKKGDGLLLACTFDVLEEGYVGRKVFTNFNLKNPNADAVKIGLGMLSSLYKAATGKAGLPDDSAELHGRPVIAKVKFKPADKGFEAGNEIKGYYAAENAKPVVRKSTPAKTQQPAESDEGAATDEVTFEDDDIPF